MNRRVAARVAAPVVFLLGVTVAVVLIHSGLRGRSATTTVGPVTHASTAPVPKRTKTVGKTRFYVVRRGDTFGAIAAREGTTVGELERLNPGVSSNSLHVGQKIRVR